MPKTEIGDYSENDADNTDISGIALSDATFIDALDNIARAQMGALKRWFKTSLFRLRDSTDQTKLLAFDLSGLTAGTTRTLKAPDHNGAIATDNSSSPRYNHVIDGRFDFWSVGTSISASGYGAADMWRMALGTGAAGTFARQAFTAGQTDVPGNPKYFGRLSRTTTGTTPTSVKQRLADVSRLAGSNANFQLYAKASAAVTATLGLTQNFGTGGSPSAAVVLSANEAITTSWAPVSNVFTLGGMAGKMLGSNGNDYLELDIGLPIAAGNVSLDIALVQLSDNPVFQDFVFDRNKEAAAITEYFQLGGSSLCLPAEYDTDSLIQAGWTLPSPLFRTGSYSLQGTIGAVSTGSNASTTTPTFVAPTAQGVGVQFTGTQLPGVAVIINPIPGSFLYADSRL